MYPPFDGRLCFLPRTLDHHFLHDQYRAVNFEFAVSQLCLALKDLRAAGLSLRISILGSPKVIYLTLSPCTAKTSNFFGPPRRGLFTEVKPCRFLPDAIFSDLDLPAMPNLYSIFSANMAAP